MNFFIEMRESVTNFKFYDEIRKSRYGKVFGYLALLLLIVYSLSGVRTYITGNGIIDQSVIYLNNETPEFSVNNGILDWKGTPLDYILQKNGTIIVVDINNEIDNSTLDSQSTSYFVFRKESATMNTNMQSQVIVYKDLGMNFTKADMINVVKNMKGLAAIFIILFFPFYFGYKILNVVFLAVIATVIGSIIKVKIKWKENFIISGFALTLPVLLALLFNLAGFNFPGIAYWVISILYIIISIKIIRTTNLADEEQVKKLAMESVIESSVEAHKIEEENEKVENPKDENPRRLV